MCCRESKLLIRSNTVTNLQASHSEQNIIPITPTQDPHNIVNIDQQVINFLPRTKTEEYNNNDKGESNPVSDNETLIGNSKRPLSKKISSNSTKMGFEKN